MYALKKDSFVFVFIFANFSFILSTLVLEELKSINYEVDIVKTPVKLSDETAFPTMQVRSKYGQLYQCLLPQVEESEAFEKKETLQEEDVDVKDLLKPLQLGSCLLMTKEWWTYEFCYGQYVKQYHIEDGKIIGQVITLGLFESDYDWNNESDDKMFHYQKQRYHAQTYSNGSRCDLTGLSRTTEVRFFCEEDAGDYIQRVDEPGTCIYVLTIHTSRLCSHPRLKPLPSTKSRLVSCSPLLDDEQYMVYLRKVEEERTAAESKRSKWLSAQQERLKLMKSWSKDASSDSRAKTDIVETATDDGGETMLIYTTESPLLSTEIDAVSDEVIEEENVIKLDGVDADSHDPSNEETLLSDSLISADSNDKKNEKEEEEEDLDSMLFQLYNRRIEKMQSSPDEFSSSEVNQLDSIINNEDQELDASLSKEFKEAVIKKLTATLSALIDKIDEPNDGNGGAHVANPVQKTLITKSDSEVERKQLEYDRKNVEEFIQSKNSVTDSGNLKVIENDDTRSAILDDDKLHVRIRRFDRKSPDSAGELHEMDFAQRTKLEQAIKEKLEKSGVDTGGRKIEVKIITAGYYDNEDGKDFHTLSDEETLQFQNMIMALLTGQQEAVQEMERHKKLEENYKFVWSAKPYSHIIGEDDENIEEE